MGKKSMASRFAAGKGKKQKKKIAPLVPSAIDRPITPAYVASPQALPRSVLAGTSARPSRAAPMLSTDYNYVTGDLRKIAVVAGSMFVIIAALSFVIR